MSGKQIENELWEKELQTQKKVANYFRIAQGTFKNYRDQCFLSYWQALVSTKVLYYRKQIKDFRGKYTFSKKGSDALKTEIKGG